jgi:alcohol dehydrogenase (cytochrome c)
MDWQLLRCHGRYAEVLHTALVSLMLAVLPALALAAPAIPDTSWPGYNNGLHGERYSPLHAINRGNVNRLQPKCSIEADEPGSLQSGLVVVGDTLFFTTPHTTLAIDAATCALRWRHEFTPTDRDVHPSNRGVAYDQGRVYRGTPDGHLLALDAKTGRELWNINLRDGHPVEYVSAAPLAWKGKVFVATSGGDAGSFLRMLAFDAVTGKELWHFNLTPRDGEFGAESWGSVAEDFRRGASSWSSYALDEHTGEVFISTGNPVPALDGDARPGDNLFTNSVVVFDAESGTRRWHYQVLPADNHDWDLSTPPMLYETGGRQLVGVSSKDGHLYAIDRNTHRLVFKTPITTVLNQDAAPTVEGVRSCPGIYGGSLWNGPAYAPETHTLFIGTADRCQVFKLRQADSPVSRNVGFGTAVVSSDSPEDIAQGWLYAVDAVSGKPRWRYRNESPIISGVTVTAGGVVFAGDVLGHFMAFDARNGRLLKSIDAGAILAGGVVTYAISDRQYVAWASGGTIRSAYPIKIGPSNVTIAATDNASGPMVEVKIGNTGEKVRGTALARKQYAQLCAMCHGDQGQGNDGPQLKGVAQRKDARPIVDILRQPSPGMPTFIPALLNESDARQLADFIENWK